MSLLKLETTVKGDLAKVEVRLEGVLIQMGHDGAGTRKAVNIIEVKDGVLNVFFHAHGPVANQGWELEINQLTPPVGSNPTTKANPILKNSGKTQSNGHSLVFDAVQL